MSAGSPTRPRMHRLGAVAVALAYLGSVALSGLHLVVVEHEICDHGHVVHGAGHGDAPEDTSRQPIARLAAVDGEHDHCSVDQRSEQSTVRLASLALAKPLSSSVGEPAAPALPAVPAAHALYRLAPKQSPPA